MLGPLHAEMAYLSVIGGWLENSGWTYILHNAGVSRSGVADSFLSGKLEKMWSGQSTPIKSQLAVCGVCWRRRMYTHCLKKILIPGEMIEDRISLNSDFGQLYWIWSYPSFSFCAQSEVETSPFTKNRCEKWCHGSLCLIICFRLLSVHWFARDKPVSYTHLTLPTIA